MRAFEEFRDEDLGFWAHVKLVSERLGYSLRNGRAAPELRRFEVGQVADCLESIGLSAAHLRSEDGVSTELCERLCSYMNRRADMITNVIQPNLMDRAAARVEYERLFNEVPSERTVKMNKQSGDKRHPSYLSEIVNLITERELGGVLFDPDPAVLTVITDDGKPARTLSRRVDGAYPSVVDPQAIWEVKEYYGTTTFGSRVADGVYITMLDGSELAEVEASLHREVKHYLIVDDHFTWWVKGRSYLCRMVDMVNAGQVDEVLFGREVLERWPEIVREWA